MNNTVNNTVNNYIKINTIQMQYKYKYKFNSMQIFTLEYMCKNKFPRVHNCKCSEVL